MGRAVAVAGGFAVLGGRLGTLGWNEAKSIIGPVLDRPVSGCPNGIAALLAKPYEVYVSARDV